MENMNNLSKEDAKKIFSIAKEFSEIKPWQWLKDTDIFGIKLENAEDIIFCSVLGNSGKVKGMAFYIGIDGIESYFRILKGGYDLQVEMIHIEDSIVLYLDDEKGLWEDDHKLIDYSEVPFRGGKVWPNFRKYEPGFVPRSLNEEELLLVSQVLEVARDFIYQLRDRGNQLLLKESEECYVIETKGKGNYKESIVTYEGLLEEGKKIKTLSKVYDELELQRIKKVCVKTPCIWEMDTFNYSISIDEDGAAYFPAILLIVDTESEKIIGNHVSHPCRTASEWQNYMLGWLQKNEMLPRKILMSNPKLHMEAKGMLDKLGVKVEVKDKLECIPDIKKKYFSKIL